MHICDNPACVNIEHMRLGTHAENMADMRAKGRHRWGRRPRGTEVNTNKLTPEQVLAIRADSRSGPQIARDYGVSKTLVNLIKKRKTWRHL